MDMKFSKSGAKVETESKKPHFMFKGQPVVTPRLTATQSAERVNEISKATNKKYAEALRNLAK